MRLLVNVELPGDGWEGQPAVDAAAVLAHITAGLLNSQRESVGCDLSGVYPLYVPGQAEPIGSWSVTL